MALGLPGERDEPVGKTLARMRQARRMSGARLAAAVGLSQPKISRIERGKGPLTAEDIEAIARALGAGDAEVQALLERAERTRDQMTDWRPASSGLAVQQKTLADWEAGAECVRVFEPALVPGPLQTSGYAKLVFRSFQRVLLLPEEGQTEAALLSAVSARVRRQEALANPAISFRFILAEAVLKRRSYPLAELLAEISHLREIIAHHPNVTIRILPDGAPAEIPPLHGFVVVDDGLVVVDLYNTGLTSRSDRDVQSYRQVFELLDEHATDIGPFLDSYESLYIDMLKATSGR
ncbi:Scr1 family TA system antitoxin-like transcriptional regulator [Actinoplanes sp. NPDC051851]|uniref:Scr1 family TA system antitoxin-like transcriptional regulator n=1 Tax=Actinoplanes sp. NPDC051851 TaxID=3154753 RepID=UPI0034188111